MFELAPEEILEGKADSIRHAIERAILENRLKPGEALPTVRMLAADLGINKNTVAAAYRQLQQVGLLVSDGRRGSVVASQTARGRTPLVGGVGLQTVSVRDGNPDVLFLPSEADIRDAIARMNLDHHLYGEQRNHVPFIDWATGCFATDNVKANGGIFVSAGALDLIERALTAVGLIPGDKVAIEDPGYMSLLALARSMEFELVPLALDSHGITPASLKAALSLGAKAVLVTSRAHNPTGVATSKSRSAELKKIAANAKDVLFVDDDHSSLLELSPYHPWHMRESGRWLTVRSMSKFLGPDYRLAVTTGDADTIQRLESRQSMGMGWVSTFLQRLALRLLHSAAVKKKIADAGIAYRERYETLRSALNSKGFDIIGSAGLNLWVPIANERDVAERLFESGWLVRPGHDFCISKHSGIRVTSSRITPQQCILFIDALVATRRATTTTLTA